MNTSSEAGSDHLTTRVVHRVEEGLVAAVDRLVPQLSETASVPGRWELDQMIADPNAILIVAERAGVTVGLVALVVFRAPSGVHARIEDLVVDEHARGAGVTERLMRRALKTAAGRGATFVEVTCPESKVGVGRMYERLGFERQSASALVCRLSG